MKENEEVNDLEVVDAEVLTPKGEADMKKAFEKLRNRPYVKILNSEGKVANPITKDNPYTTVFLNRRDRKAAVRKATKHPKNNSKGARVIVTKIGPASFTKTHVSKQLIKGNMVPIWSDEGVLLGHIDRKKRTVIHNQLK